MRLRAQLSAYEEQFQELNDFKRKYFEFKERIDTQASRTLDESAPRVESLSKELSETLEASTTLIKEREQAETRLEQAREEVHRLTEQKTKHESELEQLRKKIEASQQAGQKTYAAEMQWPSASPMPRAPLLYDTPQVVAATAVTPGFQPGNGLQYTTMQQLNEYGILPSLPVHSTAGYDTEKKQRIMEALKSPEYGLMSEGDMKAASALTALHALRSQVHNKYSLPGRFAAPLSIKDRSNMITEVTSIAQAQNANLARILSRDKHFTHSDVLSCACDIIAELYVKWPRHMLMEAFKKKELEEVIAAFTSAFEKQIPSVQRFGEEGREEHRKHAEACILVAEEDDAVIWNIVHYAFKPLDTGLKHKLDEKAVDAMAEAGVNAIDEVHHHQRFAELHVVINFLCKTSWAYGVRALVELIQLPDLFKHRYQSCLQTFCTDYQTQLKSFVRRYAIVDQSMLLDFAVMRVKQESDARHIADARQELERRRVISGAIQDPGLYRFQPQADFGADAVAGANFGSRTCPAATSPASAPNRRSAQAARPG